MIGDDDSLSRLLKHDTMDGCLVRIIRSQPALRVHSVYTDKCLIDEHLAGIALRDISHQGEPVTTQKTPRHTNFDIYQVAQLHGDVDSVGQDCNAFTMADAAGHLCRGSTGPDGNDVAVRDQARRENSDPSFLGRAFFFLLLK